MVRCDQFGALQIGNRARHGADAVVAARTAVFPAHFMLVGAMNPCPCGYYGDSLRECRCTPQAIMRYRDRLSGPLRDRLDLLVDVPGLPPDLLTADTRGEPSQAVRERVVTARMRQRDRYQSHGIRTNAELTPSLAAKHCALDRAGTKLIQASVSRLGLSAQCFAASDGVSSAFVRMPCD